METLSISRLKPYNLLALSPLKSNSSWAIPTQKHGNFLFPVVFSSFPRNPTSQKIKFYQQNPSVRAQRLQNIQRNTIVKSEIATTGSPENKRYSIADFQLGSRIRAIYFYTLTAIAAIPLFVVMVLMHPFVLLFDRYRRRAHHLIAKIWASVTIVPFYRFELEGLENLPSRDVPAVYVSNHQSFLDIYTLLTLGRSFKFISKRAIFLFPIVGWAMFLMGIIPLRRMDSRSQMECLKRCMDLVKKGTSVFFFPEGTRSIDGKLGEFKKGAFTIAAKTEVPVVPITLLGTGNLMPARMEGNLNSGSVKVIIHRPLMGKNADILCNEARNVIADTLVLHGYGLHCTMPLLNNHIEPDPENSGKQFLGFSR